jgi:telomerase reverse transcriptase
MQSGSPKLYFVKVDVRTCFDSIEQKKLLEILQRILSEVSSIPSAHILGSHIRRYAL